MAGPDGALATVQYGGGMLTIYGCVRQGSQVACDCDFNNQNQNRTQYDTNWWRDTYVIDQFGDRHARASGYFVNGEGKPRETIDIPYGQSSRYIMIFNDVSSNAASVSLHSAYGQLDVENMALDGNTNGGAGNAANAGSDNSSVADTGQALKNTGKQQADAAKGKAMDKANQSLQKALNKIPH